MPWHVAKSTSCPDSKPWAVIKDADGSVAGCHATREAANLQVAALYAQESWEEMQHKAFSVDVKADSDGEAGSFEALVAVFGNVDSVGDRIVPGAFSKTLERWRGAGDPIPIILSHKHDDPMAHIGIADPNDVVETDRGLRVRGTLDIHDNETAKQVHRLMKRRSLKEFSFGYRVPRGGERAAKDGANELLEIDLVEIGPTLKGANPSTELHAVKSALEKATWTTAYINDLPDSAFLYIEAGGEKDAEGKTTPRSLRHFPYKDASGAVDMAHLRNAAARIPQASIPQEVKDRLAARVSRMLEERKDEPPNEKALRRESWESHLSDLTAGLPSAAALASESIEQLQGRVEQLGGELQAAREGSKAPASEGELRRKEQQDRLKGLDVPEGEPEPPGEVRFAQIEAELALIKQALAEREPEPEPQPLTANELRRMHSMDRLKDAAVPVGEPEPEPDPMVELRGALERLQSDLAEVKAEVQRPPEPPAEEELRRADAEARLREAEVAASEPVNPLAEVAGQLGEQMTALKAELEAVKAAVEREPEPTDGDLRRRAQAERLKDATEGVPPAPPQPDVAQELREQLKQLTDTVSELAAQMQQRLDRIEDSVSEERLAKDAGQDPLRKRSREVVLEIASRGLSQRKPPKTREPEQPEGLNEQALKRQSRDVMLELLTGREES